MKTQKYLPNNSDNIIYSMFSIFLYFCHIFPLPLPSLNGSLNGNISLPCYFYFKHTHMHIHMHVHTCTHTHRVGSIALFLTSKNIPNFKHSHSPNHFRATEQLPTVSTPKNEKYNYLISNGHLILVTFTSIFSFK